MVAVGLLVFVLDRRASNADVSTDGALKWSAAEEWITDGLNYGETRYSLINDVNGNARDWVCVDILLECSSGEGVQEHTPLFCMCVICATIYKKRKK